MSIRHPHSTPRAFRLASLGLVACAMALGACRGEGYDFGDGKIDFDPDRPDFDEPEPVDPYEGDNEIVLEAQREFPTGIEFHQKVIWRTCTPNQGVCHNSKEYPDLRTPASFASAFKSPCNVQSGEFQSVYDGCEQVGDRVQIGGGFSTNQIELGWIEYIPGEPEDYSEENLPGDESPGLHLHLRQQLTTDRVQTYASAEFSRKFVVDGTVEEIVFENFSTRWWLVGDGSHLIGEVRNYQANQAEALATIGTLVQGDTNRNGIFGADVYTPAALLQPGSPEDSYLIARLRGEMHGESIPGSRMPLANQPFTIPEMLALYCLVEGFPADGDTTGLSGPIDYKSCSYSVDPENLNLLGEGVTWKGRISKILEFNCGGCHSEPDAEEGLNLLGDGVYDRLLAPSTQVPELNLIQPGDPENSYLYMKLINADGIKGNRMPYNPLTGEGELTQAEIDDILTWIVNGAVEDE